MSDEKIKIALIEPCSTAPYDSLIVSTESGTWSEVLLEVEQELDSQFIDKPWGEIEMTVKCREVTQEWLDEHTEE